MSDPVPPAGVPNSDTFTDVPTVPNLDTNIKIPPMGDGHGRDDRKAHKELIGLSMPIIA